MWLTPLETIAVAACIWHFVGPVSLLPVLLVVSVTPLQAALGVLIGKFRYVIHHLKYSLPTQVPHHMVCLLPNSGTPLPSIGVLMAKLRYITPSKSGTHHLVWVLPNSGSSHHYRRHLVCSLLTVTPMIGMFIAKTATSPSHLVYAWCSHGQTQVHCTSTHHLWFT